MQIHQFICLCKRLLDFVCKRIEAALQLLKKANNQIVQFAFGFWSLADVMKQAYETEYFVKNVDV